MMGYLGRGMDATAHTLPTFMRLDAKMLNAVAKLIGQGEECVRTRAWDALWDDGQGTRTV